MCRRYGARIADRSEVQQPPAVLRDLRAEVDDALAATLERLLPRLVALHPDLEPVAAELRGFVADGKRIRPSLLLLGFEAAGGEAREQVHGPALALEFLHTCALVHDDLIDRAKTRRGRPTVDRSFACQHREEGWSGDADAYGQGVAILVGDLAFVHADEVFFEAEVPERALLDGFRRYTRMREEVMAGQFLDLHAATIRSSDRELALTIASLKSGRYSVARPLEIGAALAGAPEQLLADLRAVGEPLGRAFQIRDDLLGTFGEEVTTGKSSWSDLAEGKRTLLVTEAAAALDEKGRTELEAGLGDPELDEVGAARLRSLIESSGARRRAEVYVERSLAEASRALDELGLPAGPSAAILQMANYLVDRIS